MNAIWLLESNVVPAPAAEAVSRPWTSLNVNLNAYLAVYQTCLFGIHLLPNHFFAAGLFMRTNWQISIFDLFCWVKDEQHKMGKLIADVQCTSLLLILYKSIKTSHQDMEQSKRNSLRHETDFSVTFNILKKMGILVYYDTEFSSNCLCPKISASAYKSTIHSSYRSHCSHWNLQTKNMPSTQTSNAPIAPQTSQRRTLPPCLFSLNTNPDVWISIHAHLAMPCYSPNPFPLYSFLFCIWHDLCIYPRQWASVVSRLPRVTTLQIIDQKRVVAECH